MKIVVCLFVVAAFIATGETLKCYECSMTNPKCHEFDKSAATERTCPPGLDRCLKFSGTLSNGTSLTQRGCGYAEIVRAQATNVTLESRSEHWCSKDLCNGVGSTGATLTTLIVLMVPLIFQN